MLHVIDKDHFTNCLSCSAGQLVENDPAGHIVEEELVLLHLGRDEGVAAVLVRPLEQELGLLALPDVLSIPGWFNSNRLLTKIRDDYRYVKNEKLLFIFAKQLVFFHNPQK
jgi:hypothetical protein